MTSKNNYIPQRIYDKAKEGGYEEYSPRIKEVMEITGSNWIPWEVAVFDLLFWEAIGKALNWGVVTGPVWDEASEEMRKEMEKETLAFEVMSRAAYFHKLVLGGADTTAFWEGVLPEKV